jgi:hypothetical protein
MSVRLKVIENKLLAGSKPIWINGINTPWQKWNDFDGNMNADFWERELSRLVRDNINCTRIWVNCDSEKIVKLDDSGNVLEVVPGHWDNLDKLFCFAEKSGIYIMATLLSFDHFKKQHLSFDKWRKMITSTSGVDSFIEKYVLEFIRRYKDNEYICIDLMNEPDWVFENEESGQIPWENLSYFFGRSSAAIHANSQIAVTVGIGMVKYNSEKYAGNKVSDEYLQKLTGDKNAYMDFYSPHYYCWMKSKQGYPFTQTPCEFGLDGSKPCIIAETANFDLEESGQTCKEKYLSAFENGYGGVMAWVTTYKAADEIWNGYSHIKKATDAIAEKNFDLIFPHGKK